MTRPIKFRVWNEKQKVMLIDQDVMNFTLAQLNGIVGAIIMQYTGLKDRLGKEIYEGDILKYDEDIIVVQSPRWYSCDAFTEYGYHNLGSFQDDYDNEQEPSRIIREGEIIGNIYENRDLIKTT